MIRPPWASNETFLTDYSGWKIGSRSVSPEYLAEADFTSFDDKGKLSGILNEVQEYQPGQYYVPVFGTRDTRSLDFTLRGSLTLTSKFSMQLYSQLFVAKGRYSNFSILTNPDNMAPFPEYPKKRDFNYKNLQLNYVTRWEYRPGSALYVVWSHSRSKDEELNPLAPWGDSIYDQSFRGQVTELFRTFQQNSFMLKLDYAFH